MGLELKLLIGVLLTALLAGAGFAGGYKVGSDHVTSEWNADKVAQAKTVADAQAKIITLQQQQETAIEAVQNDYETKLSAANATSTALDSLLRQYENRLRAGAVRPAAAAAAGAPAATQVPASNAAIDAAVANAIDACQSDAAQLAALIEWVNSLSPPTPPK
jgi:cell pole-organizing protein PopZ